MKKIISILLITLIMLIYLVPTLSLAASNELANNELLKFRNFTIKKTTTVEEINKFYGNPKVEGLSAFGGNSYSYYDNDLTWYLHIETNANGVIKGLGCIGEGFVSKNYKYGDDYDGIYYYLSGEVMTDYDTNKIIGMYEYNCSGNDVNDYWTRYTSDAKYLYDLQKHTIIVSKYLAQKHNNDFTQTYIDEDLFYTNEQLKANGTDLYNYGVDTGKDKYISFIRSGVEQFYDSLPNPIGLGKGSENYERASNYKYLFFDIKITSKNPLKFFTTIVFIDPNFMEEKNEVQLTEREKELLADVREEYKKQIENVDLANKFAEETGSLFEEEPVYDKLPLNAGKWNDYALQAATAELNVARVGLGLTPVTLNEDMALAAQNKSVLVLYNSGHGLTSGHFPAKPDGVSDEFYNKAQSYMNENLYHGNVQDSIINALNDGYGDAISCGHRYNLLEPSFTEWGVGSAGSGLSFGWQGVHKLKNSGSYNSVELVAWPSNGIFPIEMAYSGIGNWTARFYKNYSVTSDTEVTIKCLNNGKVYEINKKNKNDAGKFLDTTSSNMVTFRDDSIVYENGDIFEITLHNVEDKNGNSVDYTYRSVFKSLNTLDSSELSDLNVDKTNVTVSVGETQKVNVTVVPSDAKDILMKFSSSNENIAKVRQDGLITGVGVGKATITISCGDIVKKVEVNVEKKLPFKDVSKNVWYYNSVKYCYENGIIMGTTDETFSPNTNVTRGNLVTILWRMEGSPVVSGNLSFPDVKQSDYYYEAVKWAEKTGVVHGYDTGKFGPNNYISREQLATILNNYAKYKKKDTSKKADLSTFTDNKKISSYAKEGVAWAVGNKVMSGKNEGTRVDPQGKATRAETAAMIQNYCNYVGR